MPRLTVKNIKSGEEQIYNLPQDIITLGRTSACDIELNDKSISRKHAELVREGDDYFVIDLKSGNGTFLNGKKIRPIEKHLLRPNDVIKIENFEIQFAPLQETMDKPVEEDTDTDIIEIKMIKKVLRALDKDASPSLEVLNGVAEGKKILFADDLQEIDIGRDPKCSLFIDDPVISRRHAKLIRKWGGIVLLDLESRNGSFVNNEKVQEKLLRDGDKIMLGTIKLLYRNPQDINIEAISQEISRKKKEALLREAEMMEIARQKQEEEEAKAKEEEEKALTQKAEEEKAAVEKAEEDKKAQEVAASQATPQTPAPGGAPLTPPAALAAGPGLSMLEKSLIGVGGLVLLLALIAIVTIMLK
jgi:pSer/pThr/pTyr-binding forkhead associated (FHA) protein